MAARGILSRITGESTRGVDDIELIVGNLQALLNTRLGDAVSAEGFGVVDLVDIIHDFPAAAQIMQRSIRATIAKYEPRLRNVSVRTVPSEDLLMLTFEISGRLIDDRRRGVVRLRSEMTHGGRVTVA
jgi:type VI secretion system protein